MFIGPCIIVIVEEWKTNLMSLSILFHITKYTNNAVITKQPMKSATHKRTQWSQRIIDSGQYRLKYTYQLQKKRQNTSHQTHAIIHRKFTLTLNHPSLQNKTTDVVIQQHSRRLLKMDILMSETYWTHKKWNKIASDIKLVFHSSTSIHVMLKPYRSIHPFMNIRYNKR
jgi:hypothetical protein